MNNMIRLGFWFSLVLMACQVEEQPEQELIDCSHDAIEYWGRVGVNEDSSAVALSWAGSAVRINFEGTSIKALLKGDGGDNYFNVIVDGGKPFLLELDTTEKYYSLASDLANGKHSVALFKRTEWDKGITLFKGVQLNSGGQLLPKTPKKRKIEIYGNSISVGYAVEDDTGKDRADSIYTNNYLSYGAITARHFDAEYRCVCKSGIGLTVSWFPLTMPELYDRKNPKDTLRKWDFTSYTPDVVVVNLMQNDSWLSKLPKHKEFKHRFGSVAPDDDYFIESYQNFVAKLREHYPEATIICALGSMNAVRKGAKWKTYIETAVTQLNDPNIHTYFFPFLAKNAHPNAVQQQVMADSLVQFIDRTVDW